MAITIFCIVWLLWSKHNQTIAYNVRACQELDFRLITTSKINFSKIHGQCPKIPSRSIQSLLIAIRKENFESDRSSFKY